MLIISVQLHKNRALQFHNAKNVSRYIQPEKINKMSKSYARIGIKKDA